MLAVSAAGAAQTRTPIVSAIDAHVGAVPAIVSIAGRELPAPNSVIVFPEHTPALIRQGGPMALSGSTLTLTYESGLIVRGTYGADSVSWEALSGPAKGRTGTERIYVQEIPPATYFVSWVEASGTTVSQVVDLNSRRVWSFVTYPTANAREAMLDRGTISIGGED
jgi:hypothetical protein